MARLTSMEDTAIATLIVEHIAATIEPSNVYPKDKLLYYASEFNPEDVFMNGELEDWAERNGYTKPE